VEHAEEAYLGPKMPWIESDLQQGLGAGMKEHPGLSATPK
jgi:hypothetical protein